MSLFEAKNVDFRYKDEPKLVLENVNLELLENSINVLVGPSGIGKSTLFNLAAGYLQPTKGAMFMKGEKITGPSWQRGVVFQDMALYPWLNVAENILFGPKVRNLDKHVFKAEFQVLLEETGLDEYERKYVYELSGGLRQRVALARSFINHPAMLMLDESFSALDNFTRQEMHAILFRLWEKIKNCVFIITHDIDEAIYLGQNVIVLNSLDATSATIVQNTSNPYFRKEIGKLALDNNYVVFRQRLLDMIK
ncbi:ATP-binding cassette domain-containing protein [Pediococcus acidilactici]|nr:ATP-binding cassette domain-containing protein [Pediococcus acidilactici]UWF34742.1 ATP-binding cassette domain-containing protein [Pediococcus acidilactici]